MTNEIDDQLLKLQEEYQKKLPTQVKQISETWHELLADPSTKNLKAFHESVHHLHGAAYTFGYSDFGKIAADLESTAALIIDDPSKVKDKKDFIEKLINQLSSISPGPNQTNDLAEQQPVYNSMTVHLLVDPNDTDISLPAKLTKFGYQVNKSIKPDLFLKNLQETPEGSFIIDLNLVDKLLEDYFLEKNKKSEQLPQLIFLSNSGEFSSRLKAVRMGGSAFLIKPFQIEDLITQLTSSLKEKDTSHKILIVEDDMDVASYTALILKKAQMQTKIIIKSDEIDKALHEFNPDLILLDINMPECNGLELASIIRQQSLFESTPIIFLSSETNVQKQLNAVKLGADDFVTKSTAPNVLVQTIKNRIARYRKLNLLLVKDNLTGHFNHSFIIRQLELKVKEAMALHNQLTAVLIDIDKFKQLNENYSHQAGDQVIKSLGLMLKTHLRVMDLVGRFSCGKFLVILPNTTNEAAKELIDELRKNFLSLNFTWNQQIFNASFTASLASFPLYHNATDIIEALESSITKAKKEGGNRLITA